MQCRRMVASQFAVWLSVAVFVTVYLLLLLFVYKQNRFEQFFIATVSRKAKEGCVGGSGGGKIGTHEERAFFLRAENSSFSKLFRFYLQHSVCSVFDALIILTCYFLYLCECVWVCVFVCCLEKQTTISKNSSSWVRKTFFLINSSTMYNNSCFYYAQFSSEYKSSQILH